MAPTDSDNPRTPDPSPFPRELDGTAAFFDRILATSPAVIYVLAVDRASPWPQAAWVSENVRQLLGYDVREALSPGWWASHLHPEDRDRVLGAQPAVLTAGRTTHTYRFLHGRGHYFWVRDEQRLVRDAAGAPVEIIGSWVDISDLKQAEAEAAAKSHELEEANRRLRELDRLKRDFINAASHELRTPLTSIKGYAEFLEDAIDGPLTPTQQGFVAQIQGSARRLELIISDLLDFAKMEAGTFQLAVTTADLTRTVDDAVRSLLPEARQRGIRLETALPEGPVMLAIDPHRIGQVLLNLVGNALKFTPAGGSVHVALEATPEEARVEVRDTGIGLAEDQLARIFEKFYQVDASSTRVAGGTGLGLAITRTLVEDHGGAIGVRSEPGKGSTFWFTLPRRTNLGP